MNIEVSSFSRSVDADSALHGLEQLGRVVANAILEDGDELPNRGRVAGQVAAHDQQVRSLALLDRAELALDAQDARAVQRHDLHDLLGRESGFAQELEVALVAV